MFDYTGYENQVKQMKAAGLNPALMYGSAGSGGSTQGGAGMAGGASAEIVFQEEIGRAHV